jgi:hypothetical protein
MMQVRERAAATAGDELPLPGHAYIPGKTPRHDEEAFHAVKALAPAVTRDADAAANIAWNHGLKLLNSGFYWEAHEVLETIWLAAPANSRERYLVQAVIQLANAALKQRMEKPNAAIRIAGLALEAAQRAFAGQDTVMGIGREEMEAGCKSVTGSASTLSISTKYEI